MQESSRGADPTARTYVYTCLCTQANRLKHVRTFLIRYRSGGTPCVFSSRGVCWNCGPSTREQCLPAPRQPPGSSCCLSLLADGFLPTTRGQYIPRESPRRPLAPQDAGAFSSWLKGFQGRPPHPTPCFTAPGNSNYPLFSPDSGEDDDFTDHPTHVTAPPLEPIKGGGGLLPKDTTEHKNSVNILTLARSLEPDIGTRLNHP